MTGLAGQLEPLYPVIALLGGAIVVVLLGLMLDRKDRAVLPMLSLMAIGLGIAACGKALATPGVIAGGPIPIHGAFVTGPLSSGITLVVLVATGLSVLASTSLSRHSRLGAGEFHGLLLMSAAGMCLLAMSHDFLTLFISLEIMSIATYVLAGSNRADLRSNESAMKYFIQGAFSTAILLFGIALYYGATGTLSLDPEAVGRALKGPSPGAAQWLLLASAGLMLVGFCFKIGAAPFHAWIPDVYEGAPTPVTGLMATGVKAAGFAVVARVLVGTLGGGIGQLDAATRGAIGTFDVKWFHLLCAFAALTMIVGNFAAIFQRSVKRMLAYSGIAHTGYLLLAVLAGLKNASAELPVGSIVFYLVVYSVMTVGAFGVLTLAKKRGGRPIETLEDFAGLAKRSPGVAISMTVFMISLAGLPPFGGFLAKFMVFREAIQTQNDMLLGLAVLGILTSVVSLYYYLQVPKFMYMYAPDTFARASATRSSAPALAGGNGGEAMPDDDPAAESDDEATDDLPEPWQPDWGARLLIYGGAIVTLLLGILPSLLGRLHSVFKDLL